MTMTPLRTPIHTPLAQPKKDILLDRITAIAKEGPVAVARRLDELSREWTSGRMVKAVVGVVLVAGLVLAGFVDPWWLLLPALSGAVLVQYLFFKRSWLGEIFSWMGYRSGAEIEDERLALRVLRGDFSHLPTLAHVIDDRDAVSRMEDEGGPAADDDDHKIEPRHAASVILQHTH